jgi:1,4-alpha-glucan branching enzyme
LQYGDLYKFEIFTRDGRVLDKIDPLGQFYEVRPAKSSRVIAPVQYDWNDHAWMEQQNAIASLRKPISIYEVHMGSWQRIPEEGNRFLTYREMADRLVPYVVEMGYTHIELLPVMEHPLDESWGYQVTGYFGTTARFGTPADLKFFIDCCHQNGIGVILDWVPAHFPKDANALGRLDGTAVYEHSDSRQGEHPHWGTFIFNYGRTEVSNFLISNALFWLKEFHADGLRVDAVASMLYLDYGKESGQWVPNHDGGHINYEAIEFLKHLNSIIRHYAPHALMIAEESTAFPCVSRATEEGGLGFHLKWNMGWMNDFLTYMSKDPVYRKYHHNMLTFSMIYQYTENFVLVISHDEVVHGKGSMIAKMPGDDWQKFANLRAAYAFMYAHPGKKLQFMGSEFAQWREWNASQSLDWHLTQFEMHGKVKDMMQSLNHFYKNENALWFHDCDAQGFQWIDCSDADSSTVSFFRQGIHWEDCVVVVANFTPVPRINYRLGVPHGGYYQEVFNTDSSLFGGSNMGSDGGRHSECTPWQGRHQSICINLPPLSVVYFKYHKTH